MSNNLSHFWMLYIDFQKKARGHLIVSYTGTQSFITKLTYVLHKKNFIAYLLFGSKLAVSKLLNQFINSTEGVI